MKTTNFFTEISKFCEHADLKLTIVRKDDTMTISVLPELKGGGQKLMPFVASGTILEMDEEFLPHLEKSINEAGGFKTNAEQFQKSVVEAKEEEVKKPAASTSNKPARKNRNSKKVTTKKASPVKKARPASGAKKVASGAKKSAPKVKPKPAVKKEKPVASPVETEATPPPTPAAVQNSMF